MNLDYKTGTVPMHQLADWTGTDPTYLLRDLPAVFYPVSWTWTSLQMPLRRGVAPWQQGPLACLATANLVICQDREVESQSHSYAIVGARLGRALYFLWGGGGTGTLADAKYNNHVISWKVSGFHSCKAKQSLMKVRIEILSNKAVTIRSGYYL